MHFDAEIILLTNNIHIRRLLEPGFEEIGFKKYIFQNLTINNLLYLKSIVAKCDIKVIIFSDILENKLYYYFIDKLINNIRSRLFTIVDLNDNLLLYRLIKNKNIIYFKKELVKSIFNKKVLLRALGDILLRKDDNHIISLNKYYKYMNKAKLFPFPLTYFTYKDFTISNKKIYSVSYIANLHYNRNLVIMLTRSSVWKTRIKIAEIVAKYRNSFVRTGLRHEQSLPFEKYMQILSASICSIAPHSISYDTFRYWEIPYSGALLIAEEPLTIIPNNFVENKHCFFFRSLKELREKIEYCISDENEARKIAINGREHVLRYHSPSARVEYLLGVMKNEYP